MWGLDPLVAVVIMTGAGKEVRRLPWLGSGKENIWLGRATVQV